MRRFHSRETTRDFGRTAAIIAASVLIFSSPSRGKPLDDVLKEQVATNKAAVEAQAKIDQLEDETQDMAVKYRESLGVAASMEKYSDQLTVQLDSQNKQLADMKQQLAQIEVTQRDILPLMEKMIGTLARFVDRKSVV